MKRVLMVAYHFPPLAGGSGIQRTLQFVRHLPRSGWQPLVLSAHPRAYDHTGPELLDAVPAGTVVRRAFALDTQRHLSIGGRYAEWMARPDRWASWRFDAVRQGLRMIEEFKPDLLWSTYPIATAHLIGVELQRRSGIPWVADFRDPMVFDDWPAQAATRASYRRIEIDAVRHAACITVTTTGAARVLRQRHPSAAERIAVLENGYDESSFVQAGAAARRVLNPGAVTLLHSGIVYPSERDPTQLFAALGRLLRAGVLTPSSFVLRLRAAVHDGLLLDIARCHGAQTLIEFCPPVGYREALHEMLSADALLVLQAAECNEQIPAKLYEYLRAGRPILALTDPAGDTAGVLRDAATGTVVRLDAVDEITAALPKFVAAVQAGRAPLPSAAVVHAASREGRAEGLARLFDKALATRVQPWGSAPRAVPSARPQPAGGWEAGH